MSTIHGDCLNIPLDDNSVDLVFTSPPYEDARTYGIDCKLKGRDWVDYYVPRYMECLRVSCGLVAWVVQGRTRKFEWSATPAMLMVALQEAGAKLRNPPIYKRVGIPGSGGPDWLRSDYEWIVCATRDGGKLAWSDNVAMGAPPKYEVGGAMSNRNREGQRRNESGRGKLIAKGQSRGYTLPAKANPGNIIDCGAAGGNNIGSSLAHENEAPFPEKLAELFVRSFCPPDGTVLDPFCGSGTTLAVAAKHGRKGIGMDIRESQIELTKRRLEEVSVLWEPIP